MIRWFEEHDGGWRAVEPLRRLVRFQVHNLLEPAPHPGQFDIVLCRNVLLYLNAERRAQVFDRIANAMAPDGWLMMGAGETVIGQTRRLEADPGPAARQMIPSLAEQLAQEAPCFSSLAAAVTRLGPPHEALPPQEKPASWVSRYGSVTFNQYGREFPNGGMNEAGLVVELMWLDDTTYPATDGRPALDCLEWIQYQLDTAATLSDHRLRLRRVPGDRSGPDDLPQRRRLRCRLSKFRLVPRSIRQQHRPGQPDGGHEQGLRRFAHC